MPDLIYSVAFTGLDDSTTKSSETMPKEGQAMQLADWHGPLFENVRRRYGKVVQRRGQTPVGKGPYTDFQMLFWARLNGQELRLVVDGGTVKDDISGLINGGANRFTPGTECNAASFNDQVIIGNGLDPNVSVAYRNGHLNVSRLTVQPADASAMGLTAGAAGHPNGTYQYAVKFVNADGVEGDIVGLGTANTGLSPVITVANQKIILTNIPTCPAGQDCSARNIYRTNDGGVAKINTNGTISQQGSSFFYVDTIPDNTTTTYTDNFFDQGFSNSGTGRLELGSQMQNLAFPNTPFPPCRYFETHIDRLLGAYCLTQDSDTRTFHYSDSLDPTTARLSTDNTEAFMGGRVQLSDRSQGDITAISDSYGSTALVFTGGEAYLWSGTDNTNFSLLPFAPHGCVSSKTIAHFQAMMLWMAADGLYTFTGTSQAAFTGTSFRRISEDVRNTIDGLSASDLANASAVISDNRYYLCWPNGSLVMDLRYDGSWYRDNPERFTHLTASIFTADNRARIYGFHPADGKVWQLETGNLDNGKPILCSVKSPDLALAGTQKNARMIRFGGLFHACSDVVSGTLYRGTAQPVYTAVVSLLSGSPPGPSFDTTLYPLDTVRMRQKTPQTPDPLSVDWAIQFDCLSSSGQFEVMEGSMEFESAGGWNG